MSNEVTISSLKDQLANIQGEGLDDDTRAVAGGALAKRISIRGSVFRKYAGGKEVAAVDDRHMEIIFVKMAHTPARSYYTGAYVEGESVAPKCWSSDSKFPDIKVEQPESASCATCARSVQGSGNQGTSTACRLSWRTAVVLPNDPAGDVMQLVLPATSVFGAEDNGRWPFRAYIQMLAANNINAGRIITKAQFDTKSSTPKLLFSPAGVVPPEHIAAIKKQAASEAAANAIEINIFKKKTEEVVATPAAPPKEITEQSELPLTEPKLREEAKKDEIPVPDILKKWQKKA